MPTLVDPSVETTSLVPFPMVAERKYGDFRDALLSEGGSKESKELIKTELVIHFGQALSCCRV